MLWKVRALLEDRPGAMATLAARCGDHGVNILGLQIFPAPDGRVVDELVLHTPGGWTGADVGRLWESAGLEQATVAPCSPQALEDQPVRYLRAAQVVRDDPRRLEEVLCRLLDASPASPGDGPPGPGSLELAEGDGPRVSLTRGTAFTDTEVARARELRDLASSGVPRPVGPGGGTTSPADGADVPAGGTTVGGTTTPVRRMRPAPAPRPVEAATVVRPGTAADADALVAMHDRCSADTVCRRYHAPVPRLSARMARALLTPPGGRSMVLLHDGELVAAGLVSPDTSGDGPDARPVVGELGLLVEDARQRHGHGTRLLRALVEEAGRLGFETLTCLVLPDNQAVLRTIDRAGLRARAVFADGLTEYRVPVPRPDGAGTGRRRGNRPAMGEVTTGLVSLLHERAELREVYPPADLVDQAVRGGA